MANTRPRSGEITLRSGQVVGRPIFFAMVIIILAFVPVFALTGMEGKMFHPLAFTKTFAMVCSTLIAVTLVPVLCTFLIRGKLHREDSNPVMRALREIYKPVLRWALKHRIMTLGAAVVLFVSALWRRHDRLASSCLRSMKRLRCSCPSPTPHFPHQGNRDSALAGQDHCRKTRWSESVVGKIGRAESAIDPAPVNMTETVINFKPKKQWPAGTTKETILQRLDEKLRCRA